MPLGHSKVVDSTPQSVLRFAIMKSLTAVELDTFLTVSRKHSEADFWMFLVMWNHGLRVSEALNLTAENFVFGKLILQRLKGSRKTAQPILPLETPETRADFMAFVASRPGRLFPTYRMDVWRKMQEYGAEAGIDPTKRHPHALKHTCGRLAYRRGVGIPEIQVWLGHVNGKNTMEYMLPTEDEAADAFGAAAGR